MVDYSSARLTRTRQTQAFWDVYW